VIPNETLGAISDFIDNNRWIQATLNGILYLFNGIILILCGLQRWWFKTKKQTIIVIGAIIIGFILLAFFKIQIINTIFITIILPLIFDKTKWKTILITFALTNVFLFLSLWLEGFVNSDDMQYICKVFLEFDYYIMLILNYFVFNFLRKEK
jgi:hypothetical protein